MSNDNTTTPPALVAGTGSPLLALSIRQPWAWLVIHGGKDIENRSWPTKFRGRVMVHAGKGMTEDEYEDGAILAAALAREGYLPMCGELERGGIVGEVEIVDCVSQSESPWFGGPWGFVLRNPKPLPFRPCKGALGFFRPELGLGVAGAQKQGRERDSAIRQPQSLTP